ncbi:hypothetical protein BJX68DRAFT_233086 [Aspergillus pseudodeflectus]|uniref:Uncharacterized protein n=1 Tax=Aspergillus pseudodeflectus TaxID=176178 RepID=A0ABR4KMM5_9EURO
MTGIKRPNTSGNNGTSHIQIYLMIQIDTTLYPLRPDSIRRYAMGYRDWTGNEGMWVRTNHDTENKAAHTALWNTVLGDISSYRSRLASPRGQFAL